MAARQTLLLELSYVGASFHGVHPQPGIRTVSGELRSFIERLVGLPAKGVCFAARTDAGVSARQNFASMWFRDASDLKQRLTQLGDVEVPGLHIGNAWLVPRSVNARNDARSKHYRYCYEHGLDRARLAEDEMNDDQADGKWRIVPRLDRERMNEAAQRLVGRHDFSAFRAAGCTAKNRHKTLHRVEVQGDGTRIVLDVEGDAFLRKMVRIIAGTLAEVGAGLRTPESIIDLLTAGDRTAAGITAPARGLSLQRLDLAVDQNQFIPVVHARVRPTHPCEHT